MKPIESLTNVEKAKLLHQLFPSEIQPFLEFAAGMCAAIKENEMQEREAWKNGLFTFTFWLSLIEQAEGILKSNGGTKQIARYKHVFSDQFFEGYLALFMVHCLDVYTTVREHPNKKFTAAVDLLFKPQP